MAHRWVMTGVGKPLERQPLELSPPPQGWVTVGVAGCGLCHTDLGYLADGVRTKHELPLTLGHEISGRVVAAGTGAEAWAGRAVLVPAVIPCGTCPTCARGRATICPSQLMPGNDVDGGFATHVTVPAVGLCPVDEERLATAGLELADISVVADAVTTPYQAVMQAGVGAGDLAIVVGVGGVGLYAVQVARALGASVVAVDVDPAKLDRASAAGAVLALDARESDARGLKKRVLAFAAQAGLPAREWAVFECSGTGAGQSTAWSLLVHGATLGVVGFTLDSVEVRLSNLMAFHARALGNWGCPPQLYPAALDLVLDGRVQVAPYVQRHPLDMINDVIGGARSAAHRPVLVP